MEGVTDSMKITNYTQEFITDDNKPFDSAHASTLLELKDGDHSDLSVLDWHSGGMVWRCMGKEPGRSDLDSDT